MSKRFRFLIMICILGLATWALSFNFEWYLVLSDNDKTLSESSNENIKEMAYKKAVESKDRLRDLIIQDEDAPIPPEYMFLTDSIKPILAELNQKIPADWKLADIRKYLSPDEVVDKLQYQYKLQVDDLKAVRDWIITPGLDLKGGMKITILARYDLLEREKGRKLLTDEKEIAIKGALDTLVGRLDRFGLLEMVVRREGEDRILVELPGAADPERISRVIAGKGRLSFQIVDSVGLSAFEQFRSTHPAPYLLPDGVTIISPDLKALLGDDVGLRKVYEKDQYGIDIATDYTVISLSPEMGLSGTYIEDANVRTDPTTNKPEVIFHLTSKGGDDFYNLTSSNEGKVLAVVLDDRVKARAVIQSAIRDNVVASGFSYDEAQDLALILKTGALPVPLEIISQEAVGASLGEDNIARGIRAILWGLILVMIFMLIYYKGGGLVACLALSVNFFLMAAILSMFNFTLTLPSIAGFILTVGMSVDANVIIFERIKEEYHLGKTRQASIKTGFSKAFWTIVDANLTTGFAALVLAWFGKGPIQGFAVVLTVGIVCSMITALFLSRLLFDFTTDVFKAKRISMSWRFSK